MGTQLDKTGSTALDKATARAVREKCDDAPVPVEMPFHPFPFFSFHYSYREISSVGDKIHVKAKEMRFANGTLQTEEFEGTRSAAPYETMLHDVHDRMFAPMRTFLEQWSRFLSR